MLKPRLQEKNFHMLATLFLPFPILLAIPVTIGKLARQWEIGTRERTVGAQFFIVLRLEPYVIEICPTTYSSMSVLNHHLKS